MKEKILKKGIVLPLIIGIILAVAFYSFLSHTALFMPVSEGTAMANHDEIGASADIVSKDRLIDYSTNDCMGSITSGSESFVVRYKADFSNSANSLSFVDGVAFGDGISYVKANYSDTKKLGDEIVYSGTFGEHKYTLADSKDYPSEFALLNDTVDANHAVVIMLQKVEGNGISSKYTALVYQEVA